MSDALIDPVTRDYIVINGAPMRDPSAGIGNAVYLRLDTHIGSYWADPLLGSKLHLLTRVKDLARNEKLAKQYADQALAPILADGRAIAIDISTQRTKSADGSGRLNLVIEVTAPSGDLMTFLYPVKVI